MFRQPGVARNTSLRREKNSLHRSASQGSEAGVCPPPAAKRREPPFDGCVPSNECSASPEWLETPRCAAKRIPFTAAHPRGAKPVFARLRRPNGMNFNGPAHLLFHQSSASPQQPETPRNAPKRNPSPQRIQCLAAFGGQPAAHPGERSEPGVCPPPAAKRREPPFDGCVPSNECSASPEWLGTLAMPRHGEPLARCPRCLSAFGGQTA